MLFRRNPGLLAGAAAALYTFSVPTLIAYRDEVEIFRSDGGWLHPLFELEAHLAAVPGGPAAERLTTYDKVVGRAGALLSIRLGVRAIRTDLVSRRALEVLLPRGIEVRSASTVDRIDCATEELLKEVDDPDEAHRIILRRLEERRRA